MDETTEPTEEPEGAGALSLNEVLEDLAEICEERDWHYGVRIEGGADYAWSAEVRVTQRPNQRDVPDRSFVTFNAGGYDADDALVPAVEDMLAWLASSRDPDEIHAAEQEYFDRLWYYRAVSTQTAEGLAVAEEKLREVEAKYKDLATTDPFDLGVVHGKLSALRWVLGEDWDFLDT